MLKILTKEQSKYLDFLVDHIRKTIQKSTEPSLLLSNGQRTSEQIDQVKKELTAIESIVKMGTYSDKRVKYQTNTKYKSDKELIDSWKHHFTTKQKNKSRYP